jgi:transcriptional regulator with XRE-family HTH domain
VAKKRDALLRTLGLRIRHLREARGWTQEVLAERTTLDRSYIAGIEAGLRNPSIKAIARIARGFGESLSVLLDGV